MADEKTLKQKTKLLQKLSDYGLKEDKEIIELSIEDEFAMKLTKEEQAMLRKAYVADVKRNLVAQLNNIDMQNPDGTVTNLGEEYGNKKKLS